MNQRPRTIEEQVSLLRAKGMEFDNLSEVKALLARISYFRLKYFWTVLIDDSTDGDSNQIFASKYTLCLPNKEQLIAEVEKMLVRHPFPFLSSFPLLVILNAVKDLYTPTFVYTNLFTFAVFTYIHVFVYTNVNNETLIVRDYSSSFAGSIQKCFFNSKRYEDF